MLISLYPHQLEALTNIKNGSVLCGGVGSGKTRTALTYYILHCGGDVKINDINDYSPMIRPRDLYIITTAKKRDSLDWNKEGAPFGLSTKHAGAYDVNVVVDSWNNIMKYVYIKDAFFIFDEQRVVGSGAWVTSFIKITKNNDWILLTATPGDTWLEYIPIFVANRFYKNRTAFVQRHVVFDPYAKFPKVKMFLEEDHLLKLKKEILVNMPFLKLTTKHDKPVLCIYDTKLYNEILETKMDPTTGKPFQSMSVICYHLRKIVNSDISRVNAIIKLLNNGITKAIVFYNFDYELEILRRIPEQYPITIHEWNGHKHQPIPDTSSWLYLVQYAAGAESWNCISTDTIIFYSKNYSYKIMVQAAGRIDRLDTKYKDLNYYHLLSKAPIDQAIDRALQNKKTFNAREYDPRKKNMD